MIIIKGIGNIYVFPKEKLPALHFNLVEENNKYFVGMFLNGAMRSFSGGELYTMNEGLKILDLIFSELYRNKEKIIVDFIKINNKVKGGKKR